MRLIVFVNVKDRCTQILFFSCILMKSLGRIVEDLEDALFMRKD